MARWLLYFVAGTLLGFWPWWIDYLPLAEVGKGHPIGKDRIKELLNESFISGPCDYPPLRPQFIDHPSQLTPERVRGGIQ